MQTTSEVHAPLEAARAEAQKLRSEVAEHEKTIEETRTRVEAATSRGAFSKAIEDGAWTAHMLELARKRVEQHRIEVLAPLESQASQARREQEAAAVLTARTESEKAFAHAGELTRDAVRAIAAAIDSLRTFEQVRNANLTGAGSISLSSLKTDSLVCERKIIMSTTAQAPQVPPFEYRDLKQMERARLANTDPEKYRAEKEKWERAGRPAARPISSAALVRAGWAHDGCAYRNLSWAQRGRLKLENPTKFEILKRQWVEAGSPGPDTEGPVAA